MREIYSNTGEIFFCNAITKDILNLPPNKTIEDVPENFLVDEITEKETYKGNLKVKAYINGQLLENNADIYFHICYPMHVTMETDTYNQWASQSGSGTDERIIFVPDNE